jgi:hypothetical protein
MALVESNGDHCRDSIAHGVLNRTIKSSFVDLD